MNQWTRFVGFLLIAAGGLVLLTWVIGPLRFIWPWVRGLPFLVRVGLGAAVLGLLLLVGSLVRERIGEREADRALREE